jgi:hypothetical protein
MERALLILAFCGLCTLVHYLKAKTNFFSKMVSHQLAILSLGIIFLIICGMCFSLARKHQFQLREYQIMADEVVTKQQSVLEYNIKKQK